MFNFCYGGRHGKRYRLIISDRLIAVRSRSRRTVAEIRPFEMAQLTDRSRRALERFNCVARFAEAGVEILSSKGARGERTLIDETRSVLKREPGLEFAGRVLVTPHSRMPVLYTENFFVKFHDTEKPAACLQLLSHYDLSIKRELEYARNAYFVSAPQNTGLAVFDIGRKLLLEKSVECAHPELVREARHRTAFPQQWHLRTAVIDGHVVDAHANVETAWALSEGTGVTIAIIDDGIDLDHEEFRAAGKIVAPRDVTRKSSNPRPRNGDDHGTACAGVACASGQFGASGVAPRARLMPIRLASSLGSQAEADAFAWAAQHGADVISCSWGPIDGDFTNPHDPQHREVVPLPDSTRLAMQFAIKKGRGGKGCVILFAAGNGNESVDNDGYASFKKVIAVAACDDRSKKSPYSDFGRAIWCAFPSNHYYPSLTPGIWTTDRSGTVGYNDGDPHQGDDAGNYTNAFGGTSSAAPGAAGVAALVLARNPRLQWDEVRDILKQSCDKIDRADARYDAQGHSAFLGYGRLNARRAVELATPSPEAKTKTHKK
jgi:subtilisin family serine protease